MIVSAVPPRYLSEIWRPVRQHLEGAVRTADKKYHVDDIYREVDSGYYGLWIVIDPEDDAIIAAFTTRIIQYPNRKAIALDWVGGIRMKEWIDLVLDEITEDAKDMGCRHLEGYGRKAWGRWLAKRGWNQAYIAYEAEI